MKKIFKNQVLLLACMMALILPGVNAQHATTASGGTATGTGGAVYYSVGQVFYSTVFSPGHNIRQGVEQSPYNDFIIYAKSQVKFGEDNFINGNVGVTDANGMAEFKIGDVLDPYTVWAKNITVQLPSSVNNKVFSPATGGPNPPFLFHVANTLSGKHTQSVNAVVPPGNFKELKILKGVTATVNGSDYGKILIEEGANVTFTSSNINLQELIVEKGKQGINTTNVYFTGNTSVKVSQEVKVEADCRINVCGPDVSFYLGDDRNDEENFLVKGDDTWVTLNIMIPNGDLTIDKESDDCIMTGWFIIEKLESAGSTTWNRDGCTELRNTQLPITDVNKENTVPVVIEKAESFQVKVYPNPSPNEFRIQVTSNSNEPVTVRILDMNGKVQTVDSRLLKSNIITIGSQLMGGTYMAEVIQGNNRKVFKLVKLN